MGRSAKPSARRPPDTGLRLVAAYKFLKGFVLLAVAIGALRLVHRDIAAEVERWADILRIDAGNRHLYRLLQKFSTLNGRRLEELSIGSFFYAALELIEGTGLALGRLWGSYFTIVATASLLPLEVFELIRRANLAKVAVLAVNILVVIYLVWELRRRERGTARSGR